MTNETEKTLIGISFGTVYSCISIPNGNGGFAEAIANEDGDRQIPSFVSFTGYEIVTII
jgi:L1 cell adhesion molecule like protein